MTNTPIADMVDAMVASGATIESIRVAIRHAETLRATSRATLSETPGAIRSRRWREKHKKNQSPAKANDVAAKTSTERHAQRHDETECCSLSSFSEFALGKEETKKEDRKVVVEGRQRGHRLPEDWEPAPVSIGIGNQLGLRLLQIEAAAAEFRDYWHAIPGARGRKLDWDKTFNNRLRAIAGRQGRTMFNGSENIRDRQRRETAEAMEQLRQFAEHGGDDEGPGGAARQSDARLLPFVKPA